MVDRAGTQEEQAFEKSVVHQVEHGDGDAAGAQTQHHVSKLGYGRVGQNPLHVMHHQSHSGGENGGDTTDNGNGGQRRR